MESNKLKKSDYVKLSFRSYFLQNSFNYNNYQGSGYSLVMFPVMKKIYKGDEEKLKEEMLKNTDFYNTNPQTLPFITSIHATMLDNGKTHEEASPIKMALMGPLAGIGDSLSQFTIAPLFSTIGATMAAAGLVLGPIFFFIGINLTLIAVKLTLGISGYKFGTSLIGSMDSYMSKITDISTKIGVAVIMGLSVTMVKLYTPLAYTSELATGDTQTIYIQSMLSAIIPSLLPLAYVLLMFYLVKKKHLTTTKLVVITIIVAIILGNLGIITNVNPITS